MKKNYTQEELEQYRSDLLTLYDAQYTEWEIAELSAIVTFETGEYITFSKPRIKTRFCFDDSYDYDGAQQLARFAGTTEAYFIRKNLEEITELIEAYSDDKDRAFIQKRYWKQPETCGLKQIVFDRYEEPEKAERELTRAEREKVVEALQQEKKAFEKRLNTYLKRYGMTKVETWTYWGEA